MGLLNYILKAGTHFNTVNIRLLDGGFHAAELAFQQRWRHKMAFAFIDSVLNGAFIANEVNNDCSQTRAAQLRSGPR